VRSPCLLGSPRPPGAGRGCNRDHVSVSRKSTSPAPGGRELPLLALALLLCLPIHADITGTVTITGKPNSKDETFYAPVTGCGEGPTRHTENWKISPKGALGDVVVWIVDPKFQPVPTTISPPPPPEVEIRQLGCRYVPHVIAVQAGVPFNIVNGDPTIHNVRANASNGPGQPPGPDLFNIGQPRQGQTDEETFDTPGVYTLACNVHGWMQAWVMCLPVRAFGVSDSDGKFKIFQDPATTLADGDYKIDAWHPRFANKLEQTIHVKNGSATVNIVFDGAKSF
jgi:plastocyanin